MNLDRHVAEPTLLLDLPRTCSSPRAPELIELLATRAPTSRATFTFQAVMAGGQIGHLFHAFDIGMACTAVFRNWKAGFDVRLLDVTELTESLLDGGVGRLVLTRLSDIPASDVRWLWPSRIPLAHY